MQTFEYIPTGVCSRKFIFEIEGDKIKDLKVIGGCNGNLKGVSSLLKGMDINEVITRLKDIHCGNKETSCPDQIARALEDYVTHVES